MIFAALFLCAVSFAESKTLAVQIALDRAGYSCNAIDGQWGKKSQSALERYCGANGLAVPATPEEAHDILFGGAPPGFVTAAVRSSDIAALVKMPSSPAEKAKLDCMGYETVLEMFAERCHLTKRSLERLNPGLQWPSPPAGTLITMPAFPSIEEELSAWPRGAKGAPPRPDAALVRISISRFEITAYGRDGRILGLYPCSIAEDKAKLPPHGELKIVSRIANPNYTYTPDRGAGGGRRGRHVFPPGPRCPVGVAWLGLNLPGYGIHGTPRPESIGRAESHGCFRLSNWNAARLYALCPVGTRVVVEH